MTSMRTGILLLCAQPCAALSFVAGGPQYMYSARKFDGQRYTVRVVPPAPGSSEPPLLLIPPVGVGIDHQFFGKLQDVWAARGGGAMHAPDLLGTGATAPKPRKFYAPEVWAQQLDAYLRETFDEPAILVVQGGLLPCALEMWRLGGRETIAGMSLMSPPPFRFVAEDADAGDWNPSSRAPPRKRASRRNQRIAWALSVSPFGNYLFRRLRAKNGERIRSFTKNSLFAGDVDDRWVKQCVESASDARGRFATLSYLCGTIPAGGSWRDDRANLLDSLDVPVQIIRGDFKPAGGVDPVSRTEVALKRLRRPVDSYVVAGARACLPWEQPESCAACLGAFLDKAPIDAEGITRVEPPAQNWWGSGSYFQ